VHMTANIPARDYLSWQSRRDLFEKTVAHLRDDVTLTGIGEPDQVVGRAIRVSDEPYTIVGVMPPEFEFPTPTWRCGFLSA